jgi:hypothetical protein
MRNDCRYVVELPSGIIKNPKLYIAGDDFQVNDVVRLDGDTVYPMFNESQAMCGVVAARGIKGGRVLIACLEF